jgi:predicted helicase
LSTSPISEYLKQIEKAHAAGNATEHTYRPALKTLIESLADQVEATNEPKRERCGAPDFIITKHDTPIGYIETKDLDKPLDLIEKDEQLKRYRQGLHNLILTDYLEFRWYVWGELRLTARLGRIGEKGKLKVTKAGEEETATLLQEFLRSRIAVIGNARDLAVRMAALAKLLRDTIQKIFADEDAGGALHEQMEGFRQVLLHDLTEEQFADMYAQTIAYGLFAARCNTKTEGHFVREQAAYELPKTNPFLRKMFNHIAGPDIEERLVWIVDDLTAVLDRTDIAAVLKDFGKATRREDPVVHFYETFLAAYNPKVRETRGVYYTPEPVVSYIVRSVDHVLKNAFGLETGLADATKIAVKGKDGEASGEIHKVLILDPATGTGTFLHEVIHQIYETVCAQGQKGAWPGKNGYVSSHLLPRLFGFELLMAPYAVAHMKLGLLLDRTGYDFGSDERLRIYLTNTLEEALQLRDLPPFTRWLAEESNAASDVKAEFPVMVVLGNPPYSYDSANTGDWISRVIKDYYQVDGQPLKERNPKGLQDDYVKFIRFAQWRIEQTGYGVLAFVTNHGYLDNPTFRGMRRSLMKTFDEIYVLDLHGNSKKRESCPDGSKDENVFDIQQGVAIGIFIKRQATKNESAKVYHDNCWGPRDLPTKEDAKTGKYRWLQENDINSTFWTLLNPIPPHYLFIPQTQNLHDEWNSGWEIKKIFPVSSNGFKTHRDQIAIAFAKEEMLSRINSLLNETETDSKILERYQLTESDWPVQNSRKLLHQDKKWPDRLVPCLYRPLDLRFCLYGNYLMDRPRETDMIHALKQNYCLAIGRQGQAVGGDQWDLTTVGKYVADTNLFRRGGIQYFPLYLYPNIKNPDSLAELASPHDNKYANIEISFVNYFSSLLDMVYCLEGKGNLSKTFGPEDVFDYLYAVFHCPTYRTRYAEFLKIDFPRLPLTSDPELFRNLCDLGEELVGLHLLEKHPPVTTTFPQAGDGLVEAVRYTEPGEGGDAGRVWINKTQYFAGVAPDVWNFHIGGYQVCQKWLKDRKGRQLTYDDITHYQHVVAALGDTIRLMAEIDTVIDAHGGWPMQ